MSELTYNTESNKFGFTYQDVMKRARELSPRILLGFSTGKDCIGAMIALRDAGFEDIQPYYLYQVPGNLEFIEESLTYYERTLFGGRHIIRLPHPSIHRDMNSLKFQPPERALTCAKLDFHPFGSLDLQGMMKDELDWPDDALTALGVRAADSQNRYMLFKRGGIDAAVNLNRKQFYPIFDWKKDRLLYEIERSGIKLPVDYRLFGKTFDGMDIRFLAPLKKHFPRDYARILEWFPLAELEFFRYQHRTIA